MSDETGSDDPGRPLAPRKRLAAAEGGARAPILFFDIAPIFGIRAGVCSIVLETFVQDVSESDAADNSRVVVAHLRTTLEGIRSLKSAIEKLELMIVTPEGGTN